MPNDVDIYCLSDITRSAGSIKGSFKSRLKTELFISAQPTYNA